MKMDQKSLINGLVQTNMLDSGKIIKNMDLEFSILKTETSMKVDGVKIKDMDKELFGSLIPRTNSEGNTQETGKMIRKREEERCFSKLEIDMMGCGWITSPMEKAE